MCIIKDVLCILENSIWTEKLIKQITWQFRVKSTFILVNRKWAFKDSNEYAVHFTMLFVIWWFFYELGVLQFMAGCAISFKKNQIFYASDWF